MQRVCWHDALVRIVLVSIFSEDTLSMHPRRRFVLFLPLALLWVAFIAGCVTQTERIYPYERIPQDESVWEELRREFGWQKRNTTHRSTESTEPFYKSAAQGIAGTVSGWFSTKEDHLSEQEIAEDRQRFNRRREEAFQRLRAQQELDRILKAE